jgi:hypothetical protein
MAAIGLVATLGLIVPRTWEGYEAMLSASGKVTAQATDSHQHRGKRAR